MRWMLQVGYRAEVRRFYNPERLKNIKLLEERYTLSIVPRLSGNMWIGNQGLGYCA
jgi:hypothetical protein